MIVCKNCGYTLSGTDEFCPRCKGAVVLSEADIKEILLLYSEAVRQREYESAVLYVRILANASHTDSEREYARLLEKGEHVMRDFDEAMKYFHRAAKKGDAYSAYRYSRLVSRGNEEAGNFWLVYSSLLGSIDSYPETAAYLASCGYDEDANHFYKLSATYDDVDSIIELAKRYLSGTGVPESAEHAKWYMEKLSFPPLSALKLAYKLRGVKSKEPSAEIYDIEPLTKRCSDLAARLGFSEAYYNLSSMLSDLGNTEAMTIKATLLADGEGCLKNVEEAIRLLTEAAMRAYAPAYVCLAEIYQAEEYGRQDFGLVIRYLEAAGKLDDFESYEKLGKIYEKGEIVKRDFILAHSYYKKAEEGGISSAQSAARRIEEKRKSFFDEARANEKTDSPRAFRSYAIAAGMGYKSAYIKLANCYLLGIGTKKDRRSAFYWFSEAKSAGDASACYPLGLCYAMGIGVALDYKKAAENLLLAKENGSENAALALIKLSLAKKKKAAHTIYSKGMRLLYQKKYVAAKESFESAYKNGHAKSAYALGAIFEFGLSTQTDRSAASALYAEAYKLGFSDTGTHLKRRILKLIK